MTFLYVLLSIILFVVLLLSIKITFVTQYKEDFKLEVRWLFIKIKVYPTKENKQDKKKKDNTKTPKKGIEKESKQKKPQKTNIFGRFYINQGMTGVIELIKSTASVLNGMFKRIFKSITIRSLDIAMIVTGEDAAKTAINYGKVCSAVFPATKIICSAVQVKKHRINIAPDFIGTENKAYFSAEFSIIPIKITNAAVIFLFQFLFKVLVKFFLGSRKVSEKKQI